MERQQVVSFIEERLKDGPLTGSKLTSLLKESWPDWSPLAHDVSTLAAFISAFVPRVAPTGRAGLDPIYSRCDSTSEPGPPPPIYKNLWRVWASPGSPLRIEVGIGGELRATPRSAAAEANWIPLTSPSSEMHRELARDFIELQFPEGESSLSALITESPSWWQGWFKRIEELQLTDVWRQFRNARLLASFKDSLRATAISEENQLLATQSLRGASSPGANLKKSLSAQGESVSAEELRAIALASVNLMNETELVQLKLPLGLILKAIKSAG